MSREAKRSRRSSGGSKGLIALLVLVFLITGFLFAFRTEGIAVSGNIRASASEVAEVLERQPFSFNTVLWLLWNRFDPVTDEGFIRSVHTSLYDRNTLRAQVIERTFAGYILSDGYNFFFDRHGVICARSVIPEPAEENTYMIRLEGVEIKNARIGDSMPHADRGIYEQIGNMSAIFEQEGYVPDKVVLKEDGSVSLITGRIEVLLGDLSNLDLKLQRMHVLLPELTGKRGVLHLEDYDGSAAAISFSRS